MDFSFNGSKQMMKSVVSFFRGSSWLLIFVFLSTIFFADLPAFADSNSSAESPMNFGVQPILPENQIEENQGYFSLMVKPSQEQIIHIAVVNSSKDVVEIQPEVATATTNNNGIVNYSKDDRFTSDDSLVHEISSMVTPVSKTIKIPAESTGDVAFKVKIPKEKFSGLLAGGIKLKDVNQNIDKNKQQQSGVLNTYAYVIGITLQEEKELPSPKLVIGKADATQVNSRNVITVKMKNPVPAYLNKLSVTTWVTKIGDSKKIYQQKNTDLQMVPNSKFNYQLNLNGAELTAGTYQVHVRATSKDSIWKKTEKIIVTKKKAKSFNQTDVNVQNEAKKTQKWIWLIIGLSFIIIILLVVIWRIWLKSRQNNI